MDKWKINDETMMKIYDEFEQKKGNEISSGTSLHADYVPKTQVEELPPTVDNGTSTIDVANKRLEQQSLHARLLGVGRQNPNRASSSTQSHVYFVTVEMNVT